MKTRKSSGNRSTGCATDYADLMLRGYKISEVAKQFGVTDSAIRKALKSSGLPTSFRNIINAIPKGCTVTDAEVLRVANHQLAEENSRLRSKLIAIEKAIRSIE